MSQDVLIVDDQRALREEVAEFLRSQGLTCAAASSGSEALQLAKERDFTVILVDIKLPDINGIELTEQLRRHTPESLVLIITAHPSVETVVSALRMGASDYLTKPLILEDLLQKVRHLIEFRAQQLALRWHRQQLQAEYGSENLIGQSAAIRQVRRLIGRVAPSPSAVLITGESGTGKELVARAVHYDGPRRDARFITINCAAIPPTLLESQLFGYVKGAFTGADKAMDGVFATASGGTLFLDEIGDLPLELQPKLLRAVENHEILPVGAAEPIEVHPRIIASTNKDLEKAIGLERFREDLYYRLAVVSIDIPPLRDRRDDIPFLVEYFIGKLNKQLGRRVTGVTNEVLRRFLRYGWKGNVRELQNVIERAMILEDGDLIVPAALPSNLMQDTHPAGVTGHLKEVVRKFEADYVATILRATGGNKQEAADMLGVSVSSLYRRLHQLEEESCEHPRHPSPAVEGRDGRQILGADSGGAQTQQSGGA